MRLFFTGTGLLTLAFLVHVVLWRVAVPKRQTRALLLIFVLIPTAAAAALVSGQLPIFAGLSTPQALRLMLFYVSCSLAYICTYSAVDMPSPTLTIISYIASAAPPAVPSSKSPIDWGPVTLLASVSTRWWQAASPSSTRTAAG